jgi:hypothetical protein
MSHFNEPYQQQYPTNGDSDLNFRHENQNFNNPILEKYHHLLDNHPDSVHDPEALESMLDDFLVEDSSSHHHHHPTSNHDFIRKEELFKGGKSMHIPNSSSSPHLTETFLDNDNMSCTNSTLDDEKKMSKISSLQSLVVSSKIEENSDDMDILLSFSVEINSLSMEPLSAYDILEKVEWRCKEVVIKYLPCVEFLVLCQQELRIGLESATKSRGGRRGSGGYAMSTTQVCFLECA